ncbi:MAG: 50S ribosomal protein L7ae-like protein [Ruminococcaceae bacterium]|nr:50S ribosomal protein L7ae-like protein [Oscillospiraceae bacterium]
MLNEKHVVGIKQVTRALKKNEATKVFIAEDAAQGYTEPIVLLCNEKGVPVEKVPTMQALGEMFKIEVGSSVAAYIKNI